MGKIPFHQPWLRTVDDFYNSQLVFFVCNLLRRSTNRHRAANTYTQSENNLGFVMSQSTFVWYVNKYSQKKKEANTLKNRKEEMLFLHTGYGYRRFYPRIENLI